MAIYSPRTASISEGIESCESAEKDWHDTKSQWFLISIGAGGGNNGDQLDDIVETVNRISVK